MKTIKPFSFVEEGISLGSVEASTPYSFFRNKAGWEAFCVLDENGNHSDQFALALMYKLDSEPRLFPHLFMSIESGRNSGRVPSDLIAKEKQIAIQEFEVALQEQC